MIYINDIYHANPDHYSYIGTGKYSGLCQNFAAGAQGPLM